MSECEQKTIILLGAGGHGRVLIAALNCCGCSVSGILTPEKKKGTTVMGIPVLGDDSCINEFDPKEIVLVNGVGSYPDQDLRWELQHFFEQKGYTFLTVVHPGAIVSENVALAPGVQVMAGCVLQPGVQVGDGTILNSGSVIDHDCIIGKSCHIAPGCTLSGGVTLGDKVHLGTGSTVIQQICIGEGAVVAAGSVIYSNISPYVKVVQKKKDNYSRVYD